MKPGYKQTEVGVIPEEWEVNTLGSMTALLTNGFVGKPTVRTSNGWRRSTGSMRLDSALGILLKKGTLKQLKASSVSIIGTKKPNSTEMNC